MMRYNVHSRGEVDAAMRFSKVRTGKRLGRTSWSKVRVTPPLTAHRTHRCMRRLPAPLAMLDPAPLAMLDARCSSRITGKPRWNSDKKNRHVQSFPKWDHTRRYVFQSKLCIGYIQFWSLTYTGVSIMGPPKWMGYSKKYYWNGWFGGTPISGNLHIVLACLSLVVVARTF